MDWTYTTGAINPEWLFRGYTGHEHLDYFGLIHMNGRVYSPLEGRMISPDNFVQDPFNSQSYNRYAYGFNNPLKYTDPNGEWVHIVVGAVVGGAINLGMQWYKHSSTGQEFSFVDGLAAFGIGAAAGAVGAATGGAAFAWAGGGAAGAGGFISGFAGGVGGSMFATPIQSVGNQVYFGDPALTVGQYGMSMLLSGATAGIMNGALASAGGNNFWTGKTPTGIASVPSSGITPTQSGSGSYSRGTNASGQQAEVSFDPLEQLHGYNSYTGETIKWNAANTYGNRWVTTSVGSSQPNITYLTRAGNPPTWGAVRARYWKLTTGSSRPPNGIALARMNSNGAIKAIKVSKELHHINGRNGVDPHRFDNLREVWPWEHEALDINRHTGYKFLHWEK